MCTAVRYTKLNWALLWDSLRGCRQAVAVHNGVALKGNISGKVYISWILKTIQWVVVECPHLTQLSLEAYRQYSNITWCVHLHTYKSYTWALSHEVKRSGHIHSVLLYEYIHQVACRIQFIQAWYISTLDKEWYAKSVSKQESDQWHEVKWIRVIVEVVALTGSSPLSQQLHPRFPVRERGKR